MTVMTIAPTDRAVTSAATNPDHQIITAFREQQALLAPAHAAGCVGEAAEARIDLVAILEAEIRAAQASTLGGIICKLWAIVSSVDMRPELGAMIAAGDYAALEAAAPGLDWEGRGIIETALQLERIAGLRMLAKGE
ncbi:hypothetical protein [Sphingobium estronivorans]|uniref:hypothetical protein n=1 Tax=Sphingobium estronivorans TaxID=1577690 RepID=UPI0012393887|nr:hypothetical protein [Sphingobium estronivorans]